MMTEQILGQEVDIFLEHFGKKGMRWGHRSKKGKVAVVVGAGVAGNLITGAVMRKTGNYKAALAIGGAAAIAGGILTGKLMDSRKSAKKKIKDLDAWEANKPAGSKKP